MDGFTGGPETPSRTGLSLAPNGATLKQRRSAAKRSHSSWQGHLRDTTLVRRRPGRRHQPCAARLQRRHVLVVRVRDRSLAAPDEVLDVAGGLVLRDRLHQELARAIAIEP